ncbi:hypothetical protein C2869_16860 [Saccharobesus litoralis]|uniref:Uncharacterized protein n=1 Tax=Saccharobesus litoralis TaxID=2172099 RepID=A0A2S0VUU6_9ALTE|nr:hypothetical protein C2869_16860 [Saccharobesus litoralis]
MTNPMNSIHKKFSKSTYTATFWLVIFLIILSFGLIEYLIAKKIISPRQEDFYLAIVMIFFFVFELIFGLITNEISSIGGVIKKSETPTYFNLRLCISVLGILVGVFLALNGI